MMDPHLCAVHAPRVRAIAYSLAKRSAYRADPDDLFSEGMIGLMDAARTFDPAKGANFVTHSDRRIRGAMMDAIRANDWVPRLARVRSKAAAIKEDAHYKATGERARHGVRPMPKPKKINRHCGRLGAVSPVLGYDDLPSVSLGGERLYPDHDRNAPNPYVAAEQKDAILAMFRGFTREERFIVLSSVVHGLMLKEVGRAAGCSESRCSQIRTEVLERLRGKLPAKVCT